MVSRSGKAIGILKPFLYVFFTHFCKNRFYRFNFFVKFILNFHTSAKNPYAVPINFFLLILLQTVLYKNY